MVKGKNENKENNLFSVNVHQTSRRHLQKYSNVYSHRRQKRKTDSSSFYRVENYLMRIAVQFFPVPDFKRGIMTGEALEVQLHILLVWTLV
jgi:hypothetical protein